MSNYTKRKRKHKERKERARRLYPGRFAPHAGTTTNRAQACAEWRTAGWLRTHGALTAARETLADARAWRIAADPLPV